MIRYDIQEKVEFYKKNETLVHIKLKETLALGSGKKFYNGRILTNTNNHLILLDNKVGDVFIYFSEITSIEPFKEVGE